MRIIAAAIKRNGIVFTGVRHGLIIKDMVDVGFLTDKNKPILGDEQGFIDERGDYWDRIESRQIAIHAKQIKPDHGTLYSEDLW